MSDLTCRLKSLTERAMTTDGKGGHPRAPGSKAKASAAMPSLAEQRTMSTDRRSRPPRPPPPTQDSINRRSTRYTRSSMKKARILELRRGNWQKKPVQVGYVCCKPRTTTYFHYECKVNESVLHQKLTKKCIQFCLHDKTVT